MDSPQVVLAGCGFLGEAAASLFSKSGWRVLGLCATRESAERLSHKHYPVQMADITRKLVVPEGWHAPELLIHCASSGHGGADAYKAVYRDGLENLLNAFSPRRLLFTGSTSVYAQTDGDWVNEESATQPSRKTGLILLEAEALALQVGGTVARLSGIYGPGRSVLLRKFLEGSAVLEGGGTRWINQIHREDGAMALLHLGKLAGASGIYNVCDNQPATQREVYEWMAGFLGRPLPPDGPVNLNRKRGWTSKRVSNEKLRTSGWSPHYPSYREALPQLLS